MKANFGGKTLQHVGVVLAENILSKGINFVLIIIVARSLGPEQYGIYSFVTISILFLGMFLDFSMENFAIRFSGKYQDKREEIFGLYFIFKTVFLVVLSFFILLFPKMLVALLNKPQVEKYLFIIFIGCLMESYQYVITTYLQSLEKFTERALINVGVCLIRFITIFILLQLSISSIKLISFFFALAGIPFTFLFLKYFTKFLNSLFSNKISAELLKEIFHYGKWLVLGSMAINIMTRLDFYVVTSMLSFKEAGLYNSAFQLVSPFYIILVVFGKVLFPKVSKYKDISQIKAYIKKAVKVAGVVSILALLVVPFHKEIMLLSFGEKYLEASAVFGILLIAYVITLWNVMLGIAFYSLGYSKYMAIGAYAELIIFSICSLSLVPNIGMQGAAWSRLIASAGYLLTIVLLLLKKTYYK